METTSAVEAARVAAEAVRRLNHLTIAPPDPVFAGADVLGESCAVLGELRLLARRLPQALGQLADRLEDRERDVGLGVDNDDDPTVVLADVVVALRAARVDAATLGRDLAAAHDAATHLVVAPCFAGANHDAAR